jgi:hypothetical protein
MNSLASTLLVGIGATAMTDVWAFARTRLLDVPPPDYGLVGRWLAHMALHARFRHDRIAASPAVRGEGLVGWTAHYLIGISYAVLLVGIWGAAWLRQPTIGPALLVGIGTVAAPFLLMQPGMGAGFFASRTPNPASARMQSLVTHTIFGLGLYGAGRVIQLLSA